MSALCPLFLAVTAAIPDTIPTAEVTGYARLTAPVDAVEVSGQLVGVGPDAETAEESANTRVTLLIAALQAESPLQVEVSVFGGGRAQREKDAPDFKAYRSLNLTMRDMKKLDALLTLFGRSVDGPLNDVKVSNTRIDEWKQKARLAAAADAKQQAGRMLGTLGGKLGPPRYVHDARYQSPWRERRTLRHDRDGRYSLEAGAKEIALAVELKVEFSILER